jgi:hypothetical protein
VTELVFTVLATSVAPFDLPLLSSPRLRPLLTSRRYGRLLVPERQCRLGCYIVGCSSIEENAKQRGHDEEYGDVADNANVS